MPCDSMCRRAGTLDDAARGRSPADAGCAAVAVGDAVHDRRERDQHERAATTIAHDGHSCVPALRSPPRSRARNLVRNPSIGHAAASPSAQIVLPAMPCAIVAEQIEVAGLAVAVGDAARDLLEPAGALAARRALAARLVREELHDAARARCGMSVWSSMTTMPPEPAIVRSARPPPRSNCWPGRTIDGLDALVGLQRVELARHVELVGVERRHRHAARDHRLDLAALPHAAADVVDDLALNVMPIGSSNTPGLLTWPDTHTMRVPPERPMPSSLNHGAALVDDERDVHQGLDVVDDRRVAEQALDRRERRLEARLAALALERVEQRGLFAADVRAGAAVHGEVTLEAACRGCSCRGSRARRLRRRPSASTAYSRIISPRM